MCSTEQSEDGHLLMLTTVESRVFYSLHMYCNELYICSDAYFFHTILELRHLQLVFFVM